MTAERTIEAKLRSAARIEPDRLPRLMLLGESWAEKGSEALAGFCAGRVIAECTGAASLAISAGAPELKNAAVCTVVRSPLWQQVGFVLADPAAADLFAEALFGGNGKGVAFGAGVPRRPMTALDKQIARRGIATLVEAANPVFASVAPLDMQADLCLTAAIPEEMDDLLDEDNRAFVALSFRLKLGEQSATLQFAIPEKALVTHRRKLATVPERQVPAADEAWTKNIQEGLQLADLEVRALLDERQITLGEVSRFAVGQTIVLDATMESLIVVECEEQRLFRGRMGMTRDAYVVRIEEKIDPTEEFIDDILAD